MKLAFVLFLFTFFNHPCFATTVFSLKDISVTSNAESEFEVNKELQAKAIRKAIHKQVLKVVGKESYNANKSKIKSHILSKAKNIITSVSKKKVSYAVPTSTGAFDVNISQVTLLSLLKKNGFFAGKMSQKIILPLISFEDKVNLKNYYWWGGTNPFFSKIGQKISLSLHSELRDQVKKNQATLLSPIQKKYHRLVEQNLKFSNLKSADYIKLAKLFKANTVLKGVVSVNSYNKKKDSYLLEFKLDIVDVETYETIGSVNKVYSTLPGSFRASLFESFKGAKLFVAQKVSELLLEGYNRSLASSKTFLIKLEGALKYKQYNRLKNDLKLKIGAVNSLVEKEFRPGAITLELSSPASIDSVAQRIQSAHFNKMKVQVEKQNDENLLLKVRAR